jgi:tRNA threonylcarbamoyladenosine biosynthesis protein TsaB
MNDRLVLAYDTSFGPVSAAIATLEGRVIAGAALDNPAGTQAETLPPLVAQLFEDVGVHFQQLARIAVTVGPGAFTGVRVGLAFAKGLHLATGAEILGVSTLECFATQVLAEVPEHTVGVAIDAKRGEVYVLVVGAGGDVILPAAVMPIADASRVLQASLRKPCVLTGSGAPLLKHVFSGLRTVDAGRINAKLMASRAGLLSPHIYTPTPVYLRAPDARLPV